MFRVHTIQLSRSECSVLQKLAQQDFSNNVDKSLVSPMTNEARHFYIMGRFQHYHAVMNSLNWNQATSLSYKNLPSSMVGFFLCLVVEAATDKMEGPTLQEFLSVSGQLAIKLQQSLSGSTSDDIVIEEPIELTSKAVS